MTPSEERGKQIGTFSKRFVPLIILVTLTLMGLASAALLSHVRISITGVTPPNVEVGTISGSVNPGQSVSDYVITKKLNVTGIADSSYKIKLRIVLLDIETLKEVFDYLSINVTAFTDSGYTTRAGGYPKDTGLLSLKVSEIMLYLTGSTDYYMLLLISFNARTDIAEGTSVTLKILAEVVDIQGGFA